MKQDDLGPVDRKGRDHDGTLARCRSHDRLLEQFERGGVVMAAAP